MSRSLWAIAELRWRQLYPKGKEEAKNTLEEFVETAKDEYAKAVFQLWIASKNDQDLSIIEGTLRRQRFDVHVDEEEQLYAELDTEVIDLPRDLGIFQVQPPKQKPLAKVTLTNQRYFENDPGDLSYYRLNKRIYFPDGFSLPGTKNVFITYVSADGINENLEVPEILASQIGDALLQKYGNTVGIPQDTSNNKKPD